MFFCGTNMFFPIGTQLHFNFIKKNSNKIQSLNSYCKIFALLPLEVDVLSQNCCISQCTVKHISIQATHPVHNYLYTKTGNFYATLKFIFVYKIPNTKMPAI